MSLILEKQLVAHIFYNPDVLDRLTLKSDDFSDTITKALYSKMKQSEIGVSIELFAKLYESNRNIFDLKDIQTFHQAKKYIFFEYEKEKDFDWMYVEILLKEESKKRKYSEIFEKSMENIHKEGIDTALSNLDLSLRKLDMENPRDIELIKAENFLDLYKERTLEIEELKKSNKPTYYTFNNKILSKHVRMKLGWLWNLVAGTGCVDCDTEYFNGSEWKKVSDYVEGDKVLQYNEDGTSELVYPSKYHVYNAEYLNHFKTKYGINQCLSDEHSVVYFNDNNELMKKQMLDVKEIHDKNINGFSGKFKVSHNFKGGNGVELSDNEIRLMVAVIADGNFANNTNLCRVNIKNKHKKDRIVDLLNKCNIEYKEKQYNKKDLEFVAFIFKAPIRTKVYDSIWYNCSKEQLFIISDEVLNWDGYYDKRNNEKTIGRFFTTIKKNADFIQFVFNSLNYKASIQCSDRRGRIRKLNGKEYVTKTIDYIVLISKRCYTSISNQHNKVKIEKYKTLDGKKYCFTVPSSMLVLRRDDNVFITGNSGKSIASTQLTVEFVRDYNERALYVTDENSKEVILTYMYCTYFNIKYHDVEDRIIDLNNHIKQLPEKELKEFLRIFSKIDVIELPCIPLLEVRKILKNAINNDNPYTWVFLDSFDEINSDSNAVEVDRYDANAKMCERVAKDYQCLLGVTNQLATDLYKASIEKIPQLCTHQSKTIVKKCSLSLVLGNEVKKDEDGNSELGSRMKINKCRSGGQGVLLATQKDFDRCTLHISNNEIGKASEDEVELADF